MNIAAKLKENIRTLMDENQMSIQSLERKAGLKPYAVQNILIDKSKNPGFITLHAIAKAFGCSLESLIEGNNIQNTKKKSPPRKLNTQLMADAFKQIIKIAKSENVDISSKKFLSCLEETHDYAVDENLKKIDMRHLKWVVKRKFPKNDFE